MARPEVSKAAELLYARLYPHTLEDEQNGWQLLKFCEAIAGGLLEHVRSYVADDGNFIWTPQVTAGIKQTDNFTFEKASGGEGAGSVTSADGFVDGCYVSFRPQTVNKGMGIGLNTDPTPLEDFNSIDYWINCTSGGQIFIRESGALKLEAGPYVAGDLLSITYDGTTVKYLHNGAVMREVARPVGAALFLDSWWNTIGGVISNLQFGPYNQPALEDLLGWEVVFNVDICPPEALPYLAQFVGVRFEDNLTIQQQREKIKGRPAFKRGTPAAIKSATQTHLTGERFVFFGERWEGKAYRLLIRTFDGETPSEARTRADILAQKPAGIVLDYESVAMKIYAELLAEHPVYSEWAVKTYAELVAEP